MTPADRRRAQWQFEKQLRERILLSAPSTRAQVTSQAYADLFDRFPEQATFGGGEEERRHAARLAAGMIAPLLGPGAQVLEVGCGRGDVLEELARLGATCVGIEPSRHMLAACDAREGVTVRYGTADRLEFSPGRFDIVFSQQVLEHLHPDDVPLHIAEAFRVLRSGGLLAIETPNRRTGPQDISRGFSDAAEGLHLKEWSVRELTEEFRRAGFVRIRGLAAPPFLARRSPRLHKLSRVPAVFKIWEDALLGLLPHRELRTRAGKLLALDDVFLIGQKPA